MRFKFLLSILLLALTPLVAEAQSGSCGVGVKWNIDGNTLVISGEGEMYDYDSSQNFSYAIFSDQIEKVVFSDGVISVGKNAFFGFTKLSSVEFSSTIASIGESSFRGASLRKVDIPSCVSNVGDYAFAGNLLLKEVYWDADIPFLDCYANDSYNQRSGIFSNDSVEVISFGPHAKNIYSGLMNGVTLEYQIKSSGNIEFIGNEAFAGSKWLHENSMEELLYFDKCLYSCGSGLNNPKHVEIKEGTLGLSDNAFKGNKYLIGITIPESLIKMGNQTIQGL